MGKKKVWKTIKLPQEIYELLIAMKREKGKAFWKIIAEAITESEEKATTEVVEKMAGKVKELDKAIWYSFKLVNGMAMYKQTVSLADAYNTYGNEFGDVLVKEYVKDQKEKFTKTVSQIEKRLNVDLTGVLNAIEEVEEDLRGKTVARLNDEVKKAMIKIIARVVE